MIKRKNGVNVRRQRRKVFIAATLVLPIVVIIGLLSYALGGFYIHRQAFNLAAESKEIEVIERELAALDYYYGLAKKWQIGWLADRYFYHGTYVDQAIHKYLIGNYDGIIDDDVLKDHRDNHLVSQLIGVSKFRRAEALYKNAKTDDEKEKIIDMVIEEVSEDFRMAVEHGPGPEVYFDHSFNYDLATNRQAVKMALEGPPLPRLKLQYGFGNKPGDGQQDPKRLDPTQPGGGSSSQKKG